MRLAPKREPHWLFDQAALISPSWVSAVTPSSRPINTIIAALRPAYPIKRRRVRQRTQASQGVGNQKSL